MPTSGTEDGSVARLDNVSVRFGAHDALKDVTASFSPGAVGLLGPNGAGKSTMLKALLGFVTPTSGRMDVLGIDVAKDPQRVRARLGYMPESDGHIPGMNAVSFVAYCAQLAGLPRSDAMQRAHEVLYYVGLGEARYRNTETYSAGMKQRIKLAQALVHDPDLLFLDEPTASLDPASVQQIETLLLEANAAGTAIVLVTHDTGQARRLGRDIVFVHRGRLTEKAPAEAFFDRPGSPEARAYLNGEIIV